jgi:hypothetical protein
MRPYVSAGLLLVAATLVTSCYPVHISPDCAAQYDDCIRRCAPASQTPDDPGVRYQGFVVDNRSACERRCQDLCAEGPLPVPRPKDRPMPDPEKVMGSPENEETR